MIRATRFSLDHLLLVICIVLTLGILGVAFLPEGVLPIMEPVYDLGRNVEPFFVGGVVSMALLILFVTRLNLKKPEQLDRSSIVSDPPEKSVLSEGYSPYGEIENQYRESLAEFDSLTDTVRHQSMYGSRTQRLHDTSDSTQDFLDILRVIARDVYATENSCDLVTAEHAVARGEWTDERIPAAFLATDTSSGATFTFKERGLAWFAPKHVFNKRVDRTLTAIEDQATGFLTYEAPDSDIAERAQA